MRDLSNYKYQKKLNPFEKNPNAGFRTVPGMTKSRKTYTNKKIKELLKKSKFKAGDIVYVTGGYYAHEKYKVISAVTPESILYKEKEMEYLLRMDDRGIIWTDSYDCIVPESWLSKEKIKVTDSKFEIGELVNINGMFRKISKCIVSEVFKYDNNDYIFYKILRPDRITSSFCSDHELVKYREPIRIFSDIDPYGEEDWGDD